MQVPLVGMGFRPPAKDVVSLLPGGATLTLRRQPDNPYDEDAIQVILHGFSKDGEYKELYQKIIDSYPEGSTNRDNCVDPLHLGYIANSPKTGGKFASALCTAMQGQELSEITGTLTFSATGAPQIVPEIHVEDTEHVGEVVKPKKERTATETALDDEIPF